jgi:chaperonin GroES
VKKKSSPRLPKPPIRLLGDRVLALMDPEEETSKGGIILSAGKPPPQNKGTLVSVGTGKRLPNGNVQGMSVKVGDRVLWSRWHATPMVFEDRTYLMFGEDEILAVISHE